MSSKRVLIILATAAVVAVAGMTLIRASIPAPSGVVYGCYDKNGGLRVIDSAVTACKNNETSLSWNQTGPMGLPGPIGPQGPTGPTGPIGPSHAYITEQPGGFVPVGLFAFVASLPSLVPGAYLIDASTTLSNQDAASSASYSCTLHFNAYMGDGETLGAMSAVNLDPQGIIPMQNASTATLTIHDAQSFSVPTQISVGCEASTANVSVLATNTVLRATLVGGVDTEEYHTHPYPTCAYGCTP